VHQIGNHHATNNISPALFYHTSNVLISLISPQKKPTTTRKSNNFSFIYHLCLFLFHSQKIMAKAIYDNIAESPDELAFRRGDVLTVIEQDSAGLDGWWLCTLRGRQVI
jgi:Variant SH3 domain